MADKTGAPEADSPERDRSVVAVQAIDLLAAHLLNAAMQQGGELGAAEIRSETTRLKTLLAEAGYNPAAVAVPRMPLMRESKRQAAFRRLIVRPFEHLFDAPEQRAGQRIGPGGEAFPMAPHIRDSKRFSSGARSPDGDPEAVFSRRILPPFFAALRAMLGEELEQRYERQCREYLKDAEAKRGLPEAWEIFYADERVQRILIKTLHVIATWFRRYERRRDWLINLLNYRLVNTSLSSSSFLAPSDTDRDLPPITYVHFQQLMEALFAPVDPDLIDADRQALIRDVAGDDGIEAFSILFKRLKSGAA